MSVVYDPCPNCRKIGRDNAGDNLVRFPAGGAHCFACGYHEHPRRAHHKESVKEVEHGSKVLPSDFTRDVPIRAWQWLLQYGLGVGYWKPFVGWTEKDSRLVFTVGSPTEFSIGRFIAAKDGAETKRKWFTWGDTHKRTHVLGSYYEAEKIVLVEDLISAHKVGQVNPCIPLFGTNIFEGCISTLCHIDLPIVIWLDKDQQQTLPKKAYGLSSITGLKVSYVVTDKDPKSLSLEQIKEHLK